MGEFLDRREPKDFDITLYGERWTFTPSNCAVTRFRHRPELDHVLVVTGEETARVIFGTPDLVDWMAGESRDRRRRNFDELYGWLPDVKIVDYPSDEDIAVWESIETQEPHDTFPDEWGLQEPEEEFDDAA